MSREQAILSQLDASAIRGDRPEKAQAAPQEVPPLNDELPSLEQELTRATDDAEETLRAAARHLVGSGGKRIEFVIRVTFQEEAHGLAKLVRKCFRDRHANGCVYFGDRQT